jgi:hypothetical protein
MTLRPHNHQKLHDPTYIGPGIWFNMHLDAVTALTKSEQMAVIVRIRKLQSRFPCSKCKVHFEEYLERHPPEQICGESEDSLFRWTVDFHNAVNSFTGKPQVDYSEARSIYQEESIFCTADCTETTETPVQRLSEVSKSGFQGMQTRHVSSTLSMQNGAMHGAPDASGGRGNQRVPGKTQLGYVLVPVGPRR